MVAALSQSHCPSRGIHIQWLVAVGPKGPVPLSQFQKTLKGYQKSLEDCLRLLLWLRPSTTSPSAQSYFLHFPMGVDSKNILQYVSWHPNIHPRNLTPRNKTYDSCGQEWSERGDLKMGFQSWSTHRQADSEDPITGVMCSIHRPWHKIAIQRYAFYQ